MGRAEKDIYKVLTKPCSKMSPKFHSDLASHEPVRSLCCCAAHGGNKAIGNSHHSHRGAGAEDTVPKCIDSGCDRDDRGTCSLPRYSRCWVLDDIHAVDEGEGDQSCLKKKRDGKLWDHLRGVLYEMKPVETQ